MIAVRSLNPFRTTLLISWNMKNLRLHPREEAARCLLCVDAPCSRVCVNGDPARAIRAIRFDNMGLAARWVEKCSEEELEQAEKACIHYDRPIRIKELVRLIKEEKKDVQG